MILWFVLFFCVVDGDLFCTGPERVSPAVQRPLQETLADAPAAMCFSELKKGFPPLFKTQQALLDLFDV